MDTALLRAVSVRHTKCSYRNTSSVLGQQSVNGRLWLVQGVKA